MKKFHGITTFLALAMVLSAPFRAHSGESDVQESQETLGKVLEEPVVIPEEKDWAAEIRLDGWLVQLNVGVADTSVGLNANVFVGIDTILKNVNWIVPIGAEFRYKRFGFMPDLVALNISGSGAGPGGAAFGGRVPLYERSHIDLTVAALNLAGFYRVVDQESFTIDLIGGARFLYIDNKLRLSDGLLGRRNGPLTNVTKAEVWDGVGGIRYTQQFGDRFFGWIYADAGTGQSNLTWQVWASAGYRLTKNLSVSAGYRYITWDLGSSDADIDVSASGPSINVHWDF